MDEQDSTVETANVDAASDVVKSMPTWNCPTCGLMLPVTASTCPQDDTPQDVTEQLKDLLSSNYEFIGTVGTGGMSVIYKARQALMNKIVAIKMLHSHLLNDSSIMRFQQEAKAVSRLQHPNVIAIHDFGVSKLGQPYMVMDFIDGKTLADLIHERGAVPLPEAMDIFLAVVDALAHAHEHNLLHRDLKPSNIMLREKNDGYDVILVDFGIAKIVDTESGGVAHQLTLTGEIMGSPMYMSPEQCMGKKVDQRSDIYSLGCVFYEAVVGVPPHRGDTMIETIFKHLNEAAIPLREVRSDITFPESFEILVMKLLETKPEDRIQTVAEVKKSLMDIQAGALAGSLAAKKSDFALKISKSQAAYALCAVLFLTGLISLVVSSQKMQEASHYEHEADIKISDMERSKAIAVAQLRDVDKSHPTYKALAAIPNSVNSFSLPNSSMSEHALQGLVHLTNLRWLDLTNTRLPDSAVVPISKLQNLADLSLKSSGLSAAALAQLSVLKKLHQLNIGDTAADDSTLLALSSLPDVTSLDLRDTAITDKGLAYLKDMKHLVRLNIMGTRVSNAGMETLGQMKLELLKMWEVDVLPGGIEALCACKTLRSISLGRLQLSQGDLAGLSQQADLKRIQLVSIRNLKDDDLNYFTHLKSLTELYFEDCPLTDACTAYIAQMPNLVGLHLNRTKITSAALSKIANLKGLQSLRFQNTQVDDIGMKSLSQFPQLKELSISGTPVSDVGLKELNALPKLDELEASFCPNITLTGLDGVAKAHKNAAIITHYYRELNSEQ